MILMGLDAGGEGGIRGVAVKCIDTARNPGGEGGLLAGNRR